MPLLNRRMFHLIFMDAWNDKRALILFEGWPARVVVNGEQREGVVTNVNITEYHGLKITVSHEQGEHTLTFQIHVETFDTVRDIMEKILAKTGIPIVHQQLYVDEKQLTDPHYLISRDHLLSSGTVITMTSANYGVSKLPYDQFLDSDFDISFPDLDFSVSHVPAWRIAPTLIVSTRTLLLLLLTIPSAIFIIAGLVIESLGRKSVGTAVLSAGVWNLAIGFIYCCYVEMKRTYLLDKINRTTSPQEALDVFWAKMPGYEQSASVLIGLISYMSGESVWGGSL